MNIPGFTAEDSFYRSKAQYKSKAINFFAIKGDIRPQMGKFSSVAILKAPAVQLDIKLCCFGSSCTVLTGICAFSTWTCTGETETHWTGCTCIKNCV